MSLQDKYRGKRKYIFKKWWMRWLMACVDGAGWLVVAVFTFGQGMKPKQQFIKNPKRILVVRLDHIGDFLFTRPSLEALRAHYPHAHITMLVSSSGAELVKLEPTVNDFIVWDAPWFNRSNKITHQQNQKSLIQSIRDCKFDLSLDLRGDLRHHILLARAGIPCRVGYTLTGGRFLLHLPVTMQPDCHEVERNLDIVRALGAEHLPQTYAPLALDENEKKQGKTYWGKKKWRIVIHPAAGDPEKCWSIERFSEICQTLLKLNCEIILVGTANEWERAQQIIANCTGTIKNCSGQTGLRQLAAMMSHANLFIGNDSGPAHMAMTQHIATIIIWSEINQVEEWGPWGQTTEAFVVRYPERPGAVEELIAAAKLFIKKPDMKSSHL